MSASEKKAKFEAFLKEIKYKDGETLLKHMESIVERILVSHESNPLKIFEELSSKAQEDRLIPKVKKTDRPGGTGKGQDEELKYIYDNPSQTKAFISKIAQFLVV